MFRSLLSRLPCQAPSAVTCRPQIFALPRTYATAAEGSFRARRIIPGMDSNHYIEMMKGKFPYDFPGETIFLPITFPVPPKMFGRAGGLYMTRDDDIQKFRWNKLFTEVHSAVGTSFTRDIDSLDLPAGIDVHDERSGAMPAATRTVSRTVNTMPDPTPETNEKVPETDEKHPTGEPLLVLAVALSQPRQHLRIAIPKHFKSNPSLQKIIAIHVDESPAFVNPLADFTVNDELLDPNMRSHCDGFLEPPAGVVQVGTGGIFGKPTVEVRDSANKDVELENPSEPYGSLMLYGQKWVGEFAADVQVWHRDSETGASPQSEPVVFYGRDAVTSPDLDISTTDISDILDSKTIQFNWEQWRSDLDQARKGLAARRYVAAIKFMSRKERQRKKLEAKKQSTQ